VSLDHHLTENKRLNDHGMNDDINTRNRMFYELPETVEEYAHETQLWPEERYIFEHYDRHIRDQHVLDIGCGGGRTTRALLERTLQYTGLDYSLKMIEVCRRKWSSGTFVHGDAANMPMFADASFSFVLFSFNGIDSMTHEKRLAVLHEVYRVLKPGGAFAFSSHNRDDRSIVTAWNLRDRSLRNNLRNLRSYLSVRHLQVKTRTYAILSDPLAGFGYLTYYIRKKDQVEQLQKVGFTDIVILNQGCEVVPPETRDRWNKWFHYIAHKPHEPA
jgi:ubiquinone/menaquinone biosynthesis C-methylase UbiE